MVKWIPVKRDIDEKGKRVVRADRVTEIVIFDPKRVQLRADGFTFYWAGSTMLDFAKLAEALGLEEVG